MRELRLRAGMSQIDLAIALGHEDRGILSRWERDVHEPRASALLAVSQALGVSMDALFWDEPRGPMDQHEVEFIHMLRSFDAIHRFMILAEAANMAQKIRDAEEKAVDEEVG